MVLGSLFHPERPARKGSSVIDPRLFTVERLLAEMLDHRYGNRDRWRMNAEIVVNYMPPFPNADTKPACVVRYWLPDGDDTMLRYSRGPRQGYFWDVYGEDFGTPERALLALLEAPVPPPLLVKDVWEKDDAPKDPAPISRCAHIHDDGGAYGERCDGRVVANGYCDFHQFLAAPMTHVSIPKDPRGKEGPA
jgi:hypothetical protein